MQHDFLLIDPLSSFFKKSYMSQSCDFSFNILDHVVSYSIYTHLRNNITRVLPIKNKITLIRGYRSSRTNYLMIFYYSVKLLAMRCQNEL